MRPVPALQLALVIDPGSPLAGLRALTPAEQEQAVAQPTPRRRRHFVLGRLAAHTAIRQVLGPSAEALAVEVLGGPHREPLARVDGAVGVVHVSLAHSGGLAVACAWRDALRQQCWAGVDVEELRPSEVADSAYAFSRRERRLLPRSGPRRSGAGLAAWTMKEAAWKALRPASESGPAAVEIETLDLAAGRALVAVRDQRLARGGPRQLRVRVWSVDALDSHYVLAVAQGLARPSGATPVGGRRGLGSSAGRSGCAAGRGR